MGASLRMPKPPNIYDDDLAYIHDVGFSGFWTLEISVIQPVIVYPFVEICQIYYTEIKGIPEAYEGKYQRNDKIQASMLYKEINK